MTVIRGNSRRPSGDSAMPRATRPAAGMVAIDSPSHRRSPRASVFSPIIAFSVVDLPAPLDPTSATISPSPTCTDTSCTASSWP